MNVGAVGELGDLGGNVLVEGLLEDCMGQGGDIGSGDHGKAGGRFNIKLRPGGKKNKAGRGFMQTTY